MGPQAGAAASRRRLFPPRLVRPDNDPDLGLLMIASPVGSFGQAREKDVGLKGVSKQRRGQSDEPFCLSLQPAPSGKGWLPGPRAIHSSRESPVHSPRASAPLLQSSTPPGTAPHRKAGRAIHPSTSCRPPATPLIRRLTVEGRFPHRLAPSLSVVRR